MNSPGTLASLPSLERQPKSPTTKEYLFNTLGKLTRQPSLLKEKKIAQVLEQESHRVRDEIDSAATAAAVGEQKFHPDEYVLSEGEERTYIDPESQEGQDVQELMTNITNWINDELDNTATRIKIRDLEADLFDGLVLRVLVQKLSGTTIPMPAGEFVQSEERQKINLGAVLAKIGEIVGVPEEDDEPKWTVSTIYDKNLLATLRLLLCIINRFSAEGKVLLDLPKSLKIHTVKVKRSGNNTTVEKGTENLISGYMTTRDGFDTLVDHAPEKLTYVKRSLLQFANVHLEKVGRTVDKLEEDFRDGVNLLLLIGLLEGFFVPLYSYEQEPTTLEGRTSNVTLAFEFLISIGIRPRNRPVDLVRGDLKAVLRIIFCLFVKFKGKLQQGDDLQEDS